MPLHAGIGYDGGISGKERKADQRADKERFRQTIDAARRGEFASSKVSGATRRALGWLGGLWNINDDRVPEVFDARTSQIARFRLIAGAARERVTEVTGAQMMRLYILMFVCEMAGCASRAPAVLNAYSGPERADSEIAVIRSVGAAVTMIDGRSIPTHPDPGKFYYRDFRVLPGEHEFRAHRIWVASILVAPSGFIDVSRDLTFKAEAGHTYEFLADRTHGAGYRLYFWVEDAAVKAVVAGEKP